MEKILMRSSSVVKVGCKCWWTCCSSLFTFTHMYQVLIICSWWLPTRQLNMLHPVPCASEIISVTFPFELETLGKGKGEWSIAVSNTPHRYRNSHAVQCYLPPDRCDMLAFTPAEAGTWLSDPRGDARLSWPSWLVTYRDGIPTQRWSPIQVLTGPDVG